MKPSGYLLSVQQGPNEFLKDYLWRFNQEKLKTESAPGGTQEGKEEFRRLQVESIKCLSHRGAYETQKRFKLPEAETHSKRSASTLGSQILCLP
jgi:hypothetical protein